MRAAGPDPWPGGCGYGSGDTMNTFTVNDLEAADPLALARPVTTARGVPAARRVRSSLTAVYRT